MKRGLGDVVVKVCGYLNWIDFEIDYGSKGRLHNSSSSHKHQG